MDVFAPNAPGPHPAVLCIHGGGWHGGNRDQFRPHAQDLVARGFVAVTPTYRLSDKAAWPAQLLDVQQAVRWVRANAKRFGVDPTRLGAVGSSAGGHLAACLGTREDADAVARGEPSSRVQCVVDLHGIHDLPEMQGHKTEELCRRLCGGSLEQRTEAWVDASPVHFVGPETAATFLVHDPHDPTVPYEQSALMATALVNAARPLSFLPTPGSGHGFVYNLTNPHAAVVWPLVVRWLEQWLRP